jgi:hypothetical protein
VESSASECDVQLETTQRAANGIARRMELVTFDLLECGGRNMDKRWQARVAGVT